MEKEEYQKPEIEVIEVVLEGAVIAISGGATSIGERDPGGIGILSR